MNAVAPRDGNVSGMLGGKSKLTCSLVLCFIQAYKPLQAFPRVEPEGGAKMSQVKGPWGGNDGHNTPST